MQSRDFVFWLQGFFEISNPSSLSGDQLQMIKSHLALVFQHDPSMRSPQQAGALGQAIPSMFRQAPNANVKCGVDGLMIC